MLMVAHFFGENTMLSEKFIIALKLDPRPQYKIAWEAGLNPTTLSQLLTGYARIKRNDPRIIAVGKVIGVKERECFSHGGLVQD